MKNNYTIIHYIYYLQNFFFFLNLFEKIIVYRTKAKSLKLMKKNMVGFS